MSHFIDTFRSAIIQIATPFSTGTGFYLKKHALVITNHHVVEGNRQVVIEGVGFEKQLVSVLYTDRKYDLAFLEAPNGHENLPDITLGLGKLLKERDVVSALGHPFGLNFSVKSGFVSNAREIMDNGIPYLHIDVALNPGDSGGPLLDQDGAIVGINTFIQRNSDGIGFSLPVEFLCQSLDAFTQAGASDAARCLGCTNVVTKAVIQGGRCSHCGAKVELPSDVPQYLSSGVARTIEQLISRTNHDVALSRSGPNAWEIREGSARIVISYHEKTGLISADAVLCQLPSDNIKPLYEYLLRENYSNSALSLSINEQDILLSLLIYDRYLNEDTGMQLLEELFKKADYYDNVLVEQYGARWKEAK